MSLPSRKFILCNIFHYFMYPNFRIINQTLASDSLNLKICDFDHFSFLRLLSVRFFTFFMIIIREFRIMFRIIRGAKVPKSRVMSMRLREGSKNMRMILSGYGRSFFFANMLFKPFVQKKSPSSFISPFFSEK